MMKREWFTLHIHLGYRYGASSIICPDGTAATADPVMTYMQTARPGSRAPHVWLADGKSTLDLFGRGFVLLRFDPEADATELEAAAACRNVRLHATGIDHDGARALYVNRLVLVRPDGFVAWRGDALPPDTITLVDIVRGAASRERMATVPAVSDNIADSVMRA
jgi:hypothetical protein